MNEPKTQGRRDGRCRVPAMLRAFVICLEFAAASAFGQSVFFAEKFKGEDAGEKIAKCVAAVPREGGVCDARNLSGEQHAPAGFTVGGPEKPVELMLGSVTLVTGNTIHLQAKSSIIGLPAASGIGKYQAATVIKAGGGATLKSVVQVDGPLAVLQDLTVDGNKDKNKNQGTTGILVNRAPRAEFFRVTVQNAPGHGIEIVSGEKQEACCAKLQKVMAISNGQSGLRIVNSNDEFISLCEFEENGGHGIELDGASGVRLEHSDVGGNRGDGLFLHGTPGQPANNAIVVGNQFGSNYQADISIEGFNGRHSSIGHVISSNEFLGGINRAGGKFDSIHIKDSGYNVISGNSFFAAPKREYAACINISGDKERKDQVSSNYCQASGGSTAFVGTASTEFNGNQGSTGTQRRSWFSF